MAHPSVPGRRSIRDHLILTYRRLRHSPEVSQAKLRRFIEEARKSPIPDLPSAPPRSLCLVIPCFGHAAYLPDTIASIFSQTRPPDQIVFVEDRSPDGTAVLLDELMRSPAVAGADRFRVVSNEANIGQAASLNRGIAEASTDLVMILNDDDYLMHDAVESMLGFFSASPEVALIGTGGVHVAGRDALLEAPKLSSSYSTLGSRLEVHTPADARRYRNYNDLNMTHSGSCFYKIAWQAVGGYRPRGARVVPFTDRDFQLRVNAIWPVAVAHETPLVFWRSDTSVDAGINS